MSEHEIREAVARLLGWNGDGMWWWEPDGVEEFAGDCLPSFRSFVPLILPEVEKRGRQAEYLAALVRGLGFSTDWVSGDPAVFDLQMWLNTSADAESVWRLLTATPEQHCRAFVEARNEG